jgi:RimJ/RimL family protein N-acetyltransferase
MFARTERLLLRPSWPDDAEALAHAIAHEGVAMKLANCPWPYSLDDACAFVQRDRREGEADFLIFERTRNTPTLIGGIGIADRDGQAELGYWLMPSRWGLGFATEAGRAVVAIARDTLRTERLTSGHFTDNPASGRVLAKLGFHPNGFEPRMSRARGHNVLCRTFALDLKVMAIAA